MGSLTTINLKNRSIDMDPKVDMILREMSKGKSRDDVAREMNYSNWRCLDSLMRRRGYIWDKEQGIYVTLSSIEEARIAKIHPANPPRTILIMNLFNSKDPDPKSIAIQAGFKDHREMAKYMEEQGFHWSPDAGNYMKESSNDADPGFRVDAFNFVNESVPGSSSEAPISASDRYKNGSVSHSGTYGYKESTSGNNKNGSDNQKNSSGHIRKFNTTNRLQEVDPMSLNTPTLNSAAQMPQNPSLLEKFPFEKYVPILEVLEKNWFRFLSILTQEPTSFECADINQELGSALNPYLNSDFNPGKNPDMNPDLNPGTIPYSNPDLVPQYTVSGVTRNKSVAISDMLSSLVAQFGEAKNLIQKQIYEAALVEYLKRYGFANEVERLLRSEHPKNDISESSSYVSDFYGTSICSRFVFI